MSDTYKFAYFYVNAVGPGEFGKYDSNVDPDMFYMRIYSLTLSGVDLNSLNMNSIFTWFVIDGVVRDIKEIAELTSMFVGPAWPVVRYAFSQTIRNRFPLGFIFEDPNDALVFKLACPYEIHIADMPAETIIR